MTVTVKKPTKNQMKEAAKRLKEMRQRRDNERGKQKNY